MLPLILTFGALRFRPDIQITMTILVCVFAAMIIFSNPFFETPDENILTQMALTHALPPNMIRLWLLFSTGIIIAIAVWRARDLLRRITKATEQRLNLTRFLPQTVVQDLNDDAMSDLRQGQQLPLAIMFLDVRGFTQMSEVMKPEETSVFLTEYRSIITDIAEQHGGIVDKFIGDGALVIFGIASSPQESAKASLEAAVELNSRFEKWNMDREGNDQGTFKVGIGLHFGNVFLGAIGDDRRLEFTVLGDNVNIASRVEQMTKTEAHKVLASQDVINAAGKGAVDGWRELGEKPIRGRSGGINLWGYIS
jgi:adenylate cyclase